MSRELLIILTTLGLYAAVVVSPGPSFALVSRLAMSGARRAAVGSAFGFALAAGFYAILTMTGLSLLLANVGWLASVIQIAGGLYLVYLGVGAWMSSGAGHHGGAGRSRDRGFVAGLRMGILVNLSNPKAIAFFLGLYAVAIPADMPLWVKAAILACSFMLDMGWYLTVVVLFSTRQARAVYDRFGRWIERVLGAVLASIGIKLIAEKVWR